MNKLWYGSPARHWREALPVGNGHMGIMIFGGEKKEKLCFNDATLWSGYPKDFNRTESRDSLERVRELIFSGNNKAADELAQDKMTGGYSETFLPLGDAELYFHGIGKGGYRRELDISKGIHSVCSGMTERVAFCSNPDRVGVYRITSDKPFSVTVKLCSKLRSSLKCGDGLFLTGNAPDYVTPSYIRQELFPVKYNRGRGMAFCLGMRAITNGMVEYRGKRAIIKNATEVTLLFVSATGFNGFEKMPETHRTAVYDICMSRLNSIPTDYDVLREKHIADFSELFNRQSVSLGADSELSTDMLLKNAKKGGDIRPLCELFYNYGKYMTISGSRAGGQAMNLQGIWNNSVRPPGAVIIR